MPTDGESVISVRGAAFSYGRGPVLDGLDLEVRRGGLCCLMGPNGCGKSTLIDILLGQLQPSAGEVRVCSRPVADCRPAELARLMAYVPQGHRPAFPYTVRQVVMMGRTARLGALPSPGEADERAVDAALARVGLEPLAERAYTQLSGGEMQLVLLARALAQETPIILMDEPAAHLDLRRELTFLEYVSELVRGGTTVLLATHMPNEAFYFEDKGLAVTAALMGGGRIELSGAPTEVLTEDNFRRCYGVEARLLPAEGPLFRHVLPLRSWKEGGEP